MLVLLVIWTPEDCRLLPPRLARPGAAGRDERRCYTTAPERHRSPGLATLSGDSTLPTLHRRYRRCIAECPRGDADSAFGRFPAGPGKRECALTRTDDTSATRTMSDMDNLLAPSVSQFSTATLYTRFRAQEQHLPHAEPNRRDVWRGL